MRVENQTKTQVWEDSSLCPETSTKDAVQEIHLRVRNLKRRFISPEGSVQKGNYYRKIYRALVDTAVRSYNTRYIFPHFYIILLQKSTSIYIYKIWAHTELSAIRNYDKYLKSHGVTVIHIIFSLTIFITFVNYEMFPPVFRVNNNKKPWKILAVLLIYAWASVFWISKDFSVDEI